MAKPVVIPRGGGGGGGASATRRKRIKLTPRNLLHLAHRLGILCVALQYVVLNFQASWYTFRLLTLKDIATDVGSPVTFDGISAWVGDTTVAESPLVQTALEGSTAPRAGTLYLHNSSHASFSECAAMAGRDQVMYQDAFQRAVFAAVVAGTKYGFSTTADDLELVAPVVDCASWTLLLDVKNLANLYYLMRFRSAPDQPFLFAARLSNQEYAIDEQRARGPAAVATVGIITDLRASEVTFVHAISLGYPFEPFNFRLCTFNGTLESRNAWSLSLSPEPGEGEISRNVTTAALSGFYVDARTEQSLTMSELPLLEQDARRAATRSVTLTKTLLRDSWGWVHFLQLFLGLELLLNLVPLVLVAYRNLKAGKLWVGDAFVSISSTISARGVLILAAWYVSRFWTIRELCVHDAYAIANDGAVNFHVYEDIARADLLGLYLSACSILGMLTRERVDPFLACVCFHAGFDHRARLARMFTSLVEWTQAWVVSDLLAGVPAPLDGQEDVSPMQFWTSHELEHTPGRLYATVLGPVCFTLVFVVLQIVVAKAARRVWPSPLRELRRTTDRSGHKAASGGEAALLFKRVLTLFEIATGAELESRFGLMSEYDNYVFFKGMKFASADGVYSNGFVIVNDKFVMPTSAYFKVLLMKLLRARYTAIYVYEMAGTTVQQTARLVYPDTMTLADLVRLNICILS